MASEESNLALKDEVVLNHLPEERREALLKTALRIWERSVEIAEEQNEENEANFEKFKSKFRSYLLTLPKDYRVDSEMVANGDYDNISRELFEKLTKQSPSDKALFGSIHDTLVRLGIIDGSTTSDDLSFTNKYLGVFKALWGDGIPPYLSRIMQRREVLDDSDVLLFWKMSLRQNGNGEIKVEDGETLREKAERELMEKINEDGVFDKVMGKIYPDGLPEELNSALADAGITELQQVWKDEKGATLGSWKLKQAAYIKLVVIYAISHILGTIDFDRKKFLKEKIGGELPSDSKIDQKTKVSACIKLLRRYLDDSTAPDPSIIKDHVRCRVDVNFPEGVLETNNINEINYYVTRRLAAVLVHLSCTNYDDTRIRNSYVKKGINPNSAETNLHKALQVTLISSCDINKNGEAVPCPEAFPVEIQLAAALSKEDRKRDDEAYEAKKLAQVRSMLGVNVEFFGFVNHLADLFIKESDVNEERSGGTSDLSEKEIMAVQFMKILATKDPGTIALLKAKIQEKPQIYQKKFEKAFDKIEEYWGNKYKIFLLKHLESISDILKVQDDEYSEILYQLNNECIGELYKPAYRLSEIWDILDKKMCVICDEMNHESPVIAQRVIIMINEIKDYIVYHGCKTNIINLISEAKSGLRELLT